MLKTGFPAAPATLHGHAINCVPVHRFRMGRTPETGLTPAEWCEFPRYALARILMHAVKQSLRVSGGFSGGLLPVLPVSRQKRAEGLSGGADNGCYGKCWIARTISPAMLHIIANGFTSKCRMLSQIIREQ